MPDEWPSLRKALEDKIKDVLLSFSWKRGEQGANPGYFVTASSESVRLESSAASFLANCIAEQTWADAAALESQTDNESLDQYSSEIIATYLEDHGYVVSLLE
jgi:hypothetical protein